MIKNEEFIEKVIDFGANGEGVIKKDGAICFAPFCIKDEKVKLKVLKVNKDYSFCKVLEVLEPSPDRVEPECHVYKKCGGCQLQHVNYKKQLEIKKNIVKNAFSRVISENAVVEDVVPSDLEYGYRNKIQLPVGFDGEKTVIGFYAENSHRIIEIEDCPINPSWTKTLIKAFNEYIDLYNIKGFDGRKGELREITAREVDGKLIICAVFGTKKIRNIDGLTEILDKTNLKYSLYVNVNESEGNFIYGKDFRLIKGEPFYTAEMLSVKYNVGVESFIQVNSNVCKKLYSEVVSSVSPDENTTVIDAYSGAGLMTALLAKNAKKAIGIEIVKEAVDMANELCANNGLSEKVSNYIGKCEEILPDIIEKEKQNGSKIAIVLDPPRKGCDKNVLKAVLNSGANKIVYVSCLPQSLARDVGILTGKLEIVEDKIIKSENPISKYKITKIKPFDMFPETRHVETLCVLESV